MPGVQVDGNDVAAVFEVVSAAVARARSGDGPTLIEAVTYRLGPHTTADDPGRYRDEDEAVEWREQDPLERVRLLLERAGGWTPAWQAELETRASDVIEEAVAMAEALPQPTAEEMLLRMFEQPTSSIAGQLRGDRLMSEVTLAQSLNGALATALEADERVVLLGEDIGRTGGVFRITDGLRDKYGEDRVFDTPVAESGIVGAAFGMAIAGMRPVAELQFLGFSYPAYDQIINHVARIRNRSNHRFTAPMVIRIPFGGGIGAAEHHSESTEAIYAHIPGLKVVVPSTPSDAKGLLLAAIEDPDPVIFLEPIRLYRAVKEEVPELYYTTEIGPLRVEREGEDITLISWGAMMKETRAAATRLEESGVSVEVLDLRTLSPLDADGIVPFGEQDGAGRGDPRGAPDRRHRGGRSPQSSRSSALYSLSAPVRRVTGWDTVFPLKRSEGHYLPTVDRIVRAARRDSGGLVAKEFRLPDIGEGLTEAEIVRWLVPEGGRVEADQPVVEVETDKAVVEIPSPYAGIVLRHGGAEGETIRVGSVLVVIGEDGEVATTADSTPEREPTHGPRRPSSAASARTQRCCPRSARPQPVKGPKR